MQSFLSRALDYARRFLAWLWPQLQRFGGWFRVQKRGMQVAVSIGILVVLGLLCNLTGLAGNAAVDTTNQGIADSATATPTDVVIVTALTDTPAATATPTHAPATATPRPQATATSAPRPTATRPPPYPAINNNPWDYTFTNTGHLLYQPASDICNWLNCIPSFWDHTNGYVDECADGTFSHSGGVRGACSKHGNEWRPVYAP